MNNISKRLHPIVCGSCPLLIAYPVYFIDHSLYLHANTRHLFSRCVNPFSLYLFKEKSEFSSNKKVTFTTKIFSGTFRIIKEYYLRFIYLTLDSRQNFICSFIFLCVFFDPTSINLH